MCRWGITWRTCTPRGGAFASAAVGLGAGVALIRGLVRHRADTVGNFWVDLIRSITRVLLPLSLLFAIVLVGLEVIQNLSDPQAVTTLAGGHQVIPGGLVGSWEPIKLLSGDGGGLFNANSAHPFENPTPLSNIVEIVLMLLIPTAFIRTFGTMIGDRRQGWALLAVVAVLFLGALVTTNAAEHTSHGRRCRQLQLRQLHQPGRRCSAGHHDARRDQPRGCRQRACTGC